MEKLFKKRMEREVKEMKKVFIGIILSLLLTFVSGQALAYSLASVANATAQLSWSLTAGDITWVTGPADIYTAAATDSYYGTAVPVSGSNYESATLPNAYAIAQTLTPGYVSSYSEVGPAASYPGFTAALSRVDVVGSFTVNSAGTVNFTIPWDFAYSLFTGGGAPAYSYGLASVYMDLIKVSNGREANRDHYEYVSNTNDLPGLLADSYSGTFVLGSGMSFVAGDAGYLTLTAYSQVDASSVPLPAGFWLLGSGLVGLVGIRRKSFKS
jgi:hypothetical protein